LEALYESHAPAGTQTLVDATDQLCVNAIRCLAVDAVEQRATVAGGEHEAVAVGPARIGRVVAQKAREEHVGHRRGAERQSRVAGSSAFDALLHLNGSDVQVADLQRFRQWGSRTPRHPEVHLTPGVEATTGPLGQGLANVVGLAVAERMLAHRFNRPGCEIVEHRTFALASDGDLMEGVAHEAISLAGHLGLGKLVCLYDSNDVSLDGPTAQAFTESVSGRFAACGWQVLQVEEGDHGPGRHLERDPGGHRRRRSPDPDRGSHHHRHRDGPTALVLTRQAVPVLAADMVGDGPTRGAYILADAHDPGPELILMASGSEVQLVLDAGKALEARGARVRVVSFPSWELFEGQPASYKESVLPSSVSLRLAVEAGATLGWDSYVGPEGTVLGIDRFGASAPGSELFERFGFTAKAVESSALHLIDEHKRLGKRSVMSEGGRV